jgi:hypothetical protein
MEKLFQKIADNNFSDVRGLVAAASIPVPYYLIDEILAAALEGNKKIASCQVSIHAQNSVSLAVKMKLLPWALNLNLKLDRSVDFASFGSPKLRAWLENHRLLGSLGSFFQVLPDGLQLYGNQVVVDITALLPTPEQKKLLDLIQSIEIRTEEGRAIFDVKFGVG